MSDLPDHSHLLARTEQTRFEFLQTDLVVCNTFAALAESRIAMKHESAPDALVKAEQGFAAIARLLVDLKDKRQRSEIRQGLQELRIRLDTIKPRLA